ncbi:MAG: hypothetical protein IT577_24415 [Verrucomicrobiae bacterium]|nr:hypothetical protein [Verrucomicrobiae bacterium]
MAEPEPSETRSAALVLRALADLAHSDGVGYRPGRLEVSQADIAGGLRTLLAETELVERPQLDVLDRIRADMAEYLRKGDQDPAALGVNGVTIGHLRAFAAAAREFYEAAPWRHLEDADLVEVIAPQPPDGLGLASVMGAGGREYGLGFFWTRRQHDQLMATGDPRSLMTKRGVWSLTFGSVEDIPVSDADLWEEADLPLAGQAAHPFLAHFGSGMRAKRPTPKAWAFVEGLLRALARTTEQEMDTGRWTKPVETIDGPCEYELALPLLVEPSKKSKGVQPSGMLDRRIVERGFVDISRATQGMEFESIDEFQSFLDENFTDREQSMKPARTPLEQAQDLAFEALEARGRRQLQLLRKALEVCSDCADAYILLAERESSPERALAWYARGVAAGERVLGSSRLTEDVGEFWGLVDTRPYMRALFGVAESLEAAGRIEEACGHYAELLRLNPNDNQGARYSLAQCLLHLGRVPDLETLLGKYDEPLAHWRYLGALAAFAREGNAPGARDRLAAAHKANPHVRKFLLGAVPIPEDQPDCFSPGGLEEAVIVASEMLDAWKRIPGALSWLSEHTGPSATARKRKQR